MRLMCHLNTVKRQMYENHMVFSRSEKIAAKKGDSPIKGGLSIKRGSAKKGGYNPFRLCNSN